MNIKKAVKIILGAIFFGSWFQFLVSGGQYYEITIWVWGISLTGFFLLSLIEKPRNWKGIALWGTFLLLFGLGTIIEFF
jgi:hypothetical protein